MTDFFDLAGRGTTVVAWIPLALADPADLPTQESST